jgi:hypothetical protein
MSAGLLTICVIREICDSMSDETKKREKDERRRREIEKLMQSMERTAPKADADLLRSLQGIELSEGSSALPQEKSPDLVAPTNIELKKEEALLESVALSPEKLSAAVERVGEPIPSVSLSNTGSQPAEAPAESLGEEVLVVTKAKPSAVEAVIIEIGRVAKEYPYPETLGRGSVRVSEDVFSRVTMIFASQRIDKILVLSYLLYKYVPVEGSQRVPKWLLDTPPKVPRPRILVFIKDESLARRLSDTAIRFGVTETDIIENIVRKHLPEAPFQYKPKRRMRFSA